MPPDLGERAVGLGSQGLHIEHTFPAFNREFDLPATAIERHDGGGREECWSERSKHQHPACQIQGLGFGRAGFMALSALLSSPSRLLCTEAIGMHPSVHFVLAVQRL